MSMEVLLKFLPSYSVCVHVCRSEGIPPVGRGAFESSRSIQDLLSVVALHNVQLLSYDLKPFISIQGINRMRKCMGMMTHKISVLVPSLGCILMLGILLVFLVMLDLLTKVVRPWRSCIYVAINYSIVRLGGGGGNCWPVRWFCVCLGPERVFTIWLVRKCIL